jgi:3-oxoacyl-[acyl-carrier protein] reductase
MPSFEDIAVGDVVTIRRRIDADSVAAFASLSGDYNPLHMDAEYAQRTRFQRRVVHGMLVASYVSTLVGMHLPGRGALWASQRFDWRAPVYIGDELDLRLTILHKSAATRALTITVEAVNQDGLVVLHGEGVVMAVDERPGPVESPAMVVGDRVAFVTGASRGLGAAIASELARGGASVVVNYRVNGERAAELARAIEQAGGRALPLQGDVSDETAVTSMMAASRDHFGRPVSILVNNASGPIAAKPFADTSWDDIDAHIRVQIRGTFACCKAVLPGMVERRGGCIVNIGSIAASASPPLQWTGYVLAKSALRSLTRSLAAEYGPHGVRVNMVSPGMSETDLIADVSERARKVLAMQTPLRRLATPGDVAGVVAFLCSDASAFLTGADLPVSGGLGG